MGIWRVVPLAWWLLSWSLNSLNSTWSSRETSSWVSCNNNKRVIPRIVHPKRDRNHKTSNPKDTCPLGLLSTVNTATRGWGQVRSIWKIELSLLSPSDSYYLWVVSFLKHSTLLFTIPKWELTSWNKVRGQLIWISLIKIISRHS